MVSRRPNTALELAQIASGLAEQPSAPRIGRTRPKLAKVTPSGFPIVARSVTDVVRAPMGRLSGASCARNSPGRRGNSEIPAPQVLCAMHSRQPRASSSFVMRRCTCPGPHGSVKVLGWSFCRIVPGALCCRQVCPCAAQLGAPNPLTLCVCKHAFPASCLLESACAPSLSSAQLVRRRLCAESGGAPKSAWPLVGSALVPYVPMVVGRHDWRSGVASIASSSFVPSACKLALLLVCISPQPLLLPLVKRGTRARRRDEGALRPEEADRAARSAIVHSHVVCRLCRLDRACRSAKARGLRPVPRLVVPEGSASGCDRRARKRTRKCESAELLASTCSYAYAYIFRCVLIYISHTCVCTRACMCVCTKVCARILLHVCVNVYMNSCVRARLHHRTSASTVPCPRP